jgi:hypothetical protein
MRHNAYCASIVIHLFAVARRSGADARLQFGHDISSQPGGRSLCTQEHTHPVRKDHEDP